MERNGLCWCGSGKKYKKCHRLIEDKIAYHEMKGEIVPTRDMLKTIPQIEGIRKSAELNTAILDHVEAHIHAGMSTEEINTLVHDFTVSHGGIPAPLGYEGFPKSVCTSINNEVCHGIPSKKKILKDGDIINVDATTEYNGYYADASRMFMLGNVSDEAKRLVAITKECLYEGMKTIIPWKSCIGDIGEAIEKHAHQNGYSVVEEFCGHGIGLTMHEDPFVYHFKPNEKTVLIVPGMVFTIEPMINQGSKGVHLEYDNDWTVYTDDGLLSAQWEHTFLVTEDGVEIISK